MNFVYILFNKPHGTLYTGVTSNLKKRMLEHKTKIHPHSFSATYNVTKLGYFEEIPSIKDAIDREKQLKAGSRSKKIRLIQSMNPTWEDLSDDL